jgi:hypothetical protein
MKNQIKLISLVLIACLFSFCQPPQPNTDTGGKDTTKVDSVAKDTIIPDTEVVITHAEEIGLVEPMTTAPMMFKDNGVKPVQGLAMPMVAVNVPYPTNRSIYLDKADLVYNNITARNEFAKYCKDNKFNEVYFYHWSDIVQNSANFKALGDFLQLLQRNGVVKRIPVLGSGNIANTNKFYLSQTDSTRRFNGIQLELEWWNNSATTPTATFTEYVNVLYTLNNYCDSKSPDLYLTIYIGWFKQLDGNTDSSAARKLWQLCDWIDIHDYENNKVSYTYGSSRYEGLAKGAKSLNKRGRTNVIASTEQKAWGAKNDFQGYYLKVNKYAGVDKAYFDNFNTYASANVKTNLSLGEIKYFTWRYNKLAVVPIPLAPLQ